MRMFLVLLFLPSLAWAEMSAAEFEDFVTGKTLTYSDKGIVFGTEEYLPGRRVRWAFKGDACTEGVWFETNSQICFLYDDRPADPQCWTFTKEDNKLRALFQGDINNRALYGAELSDGPLQCPGPLVGV